jgi:hypothetical protein
MRRCCRGFIVASAWEKQGHRYAEHTQRARSIARIQGRDVLEVVRQRASAAMVMQASAPQWHR